MNDTLEEWTDDDDLARSLFEEAQSGEHGEKESAVDSAAFEREARLAAKAYEMAIRQAADEMIDAVADLLLDYS